MCPSTLLDMFDYCLLCGEASLANSHHCSADINGPIRVKTDREKGLQPFNTKHSASVCVCTFIEPSSFLSTQLYPTYMTH